MLGQCLSTNLTRKKVLEEQTEGKCPENTVENGENMLEIHHKDAQYHAKQPPIIDSFYATTY